MPVFLALVLLVSCTTPGEDRPPSKAPAPIIEATETALQQAMAHLRAKRYQEAVTLCREALQRDSTSVPLYNVLATAYASEGRYALAIEALEHIVVLQPNGPLAPLNLGGIHTKLGQYESAEKYLLKAQHLAPDQPEVHRRLGEVYLGTNRFAQAVQHFERSIALFPYAPALYYYLGRAHEGQNQVEKALAAQMEATRRDSSFADAFYRLGLLARRLARPELAQASLLRFQYLQRMGSGDSDVPKQMKKLRASILNAPEDPVHYVAMGQLFASHNYVPEADNLFSLAAALPASDAAVLNSIARILLAQQRGDAAQTYCQRALIADPRYLPAVLNMGVALDMGGHAAEARSYYTRAIELAPDDPRSWYAMGLSAFNSGRREEAFSAWQRTRQMAGPNHPLSRQIEKRLADLPGPIDSD